MWVIGLLVIVILLKPLWYGTPASDARAAKAKADLRTLASAVEQYRAHAGRAATLTDLTSPTTDRQGQTVGPFLAVLPNPPASYSPYRYERQPDGTWSITTMGEGGRVTIKVP